MTSGVSVPASATLGQGPKWVRLTRTLALAPLLGCAAILAAKTALIWRININWDEFNFLSHVHELSRGQMVLLLNGAYVHLFEWLTRLDSAEVGQIVAARLVMLALLVVTCVLLWRLASHWVPRASAAVAPLCYLSTYPVLAHGASFRYDSLLAPLSLAVLLLLLRGARGVRTPALAGLLLGVAGAVSIKAALLLPVIVLLLLLSPVDDRDRSLRELARTFCVLALVSASSFVLLLALHKLALAPASGLEATRAQSALSKTILDAPFFPRRAQYHALRQADSFAWLLIFVGGLCALFRARYRRAVALALSLSPILYYRNAWPYYYVVMLAPACVLASIAVESLRQPLEALRQHWVAYSIPLLVSIPLVVHAGGTLLRLWPDRQGSQREVIDAVHQVFEKPVPYVDHSGMIASFPKVGFFMSSWGLEDYRAAGVSFMEKALAARAPLLLANRPVLDPASGPFRSRLLARDRELIERFYPAYWGPIRVAGALVDLAARREVIVSLPFPGAYRIEAERAVLIDGVQRQACETVTVDGTAIRVRLADAGGNASTRVRFVWHEAGPTPSRPPPAGNDLYTSLLSSLWQREPAQDHSAAPPSSAPKRSCSAVQSRANAGTETLRGS